MNIAALGFLVGGALLAAAPPPSASLDDSKILGVLDVASTEVVDLAQLALSKTQAAPVKSFARAMIEEHADARNEGRSIAERIGVPIAPSPLSNDLKERTNQMIIQLRPMQGNRFDRTYVDSQVTFHKEMMSIIDDRLLPEAQSNEVRSFVSGVRQHIEHHMEKAEKTLEKLPTKT